MSWGGGYVTDVDYMSGWYRNQSPPLLALGALLGGVDAPVPTADSRIHVLELGCGQGYSALLLAASNPGWQVTAIDFNPAHIAEARDWAAAAGLSNVRFLEADLTTLAEDPIARDIPEADFVTMHGLWTWVSPAVQKGVVRLLRDKVRPGGLVYVSYNSLPGWGPRMGIQRIAYEAGRRLAIRSDRQAEEGMRTLRDLLATGAAYLKHPISANAVDHFSKLPSAYLAHELMNANWQPCFLTELADALSDAKLEWVASSNLPENFPTLTLSPEQIALQQRFDDPLMRETIKDMCITRTLRQDIFVRGARRIGRAVRDSILNDVSIGLNIPHDELPAEAEMPAGTASMNTEFYGPIVRMLADGPKRVGDLLRAVLKPGQRPNPAELVGILVGLGFAEPASRPMAAPGDSAMRFNRVATQRLLRTEKINRPAAAASYRMGTGVQINLLEMLAVEQLRQTEPNADQLLQMIGPPPEEQEGLRTAIETVYRTRIPVLRAAGVF